MRGYGISTSGAFTISPLEAAKQIRQTILDNRQETENSRQLAPAIIEKLIETRLCRLAVQESLGGYEAEPLTTLEVYEELASAEASRREWSGRQELT